MSEEKATMAEVRWARYRHRYRLNIQYDVQLANADEGVESWLKEYDVKGEACVRIRTIRNHAFSEEVHEPAYTFMPAKFFFDVYQREDL